MPTDGCAEHSFLLRSTLEDCKRRSKRLTIIWLDLKNAFGSVPHHTMWEMMYRLDVPLHLIDICRDIYGGSTQSLRTSRGNTPPIPLLRGIKQGCPLSPLLFNLVLEGVIPRLAEFEGYQFAGGPTIQCLAYADDLCLISGSKEEAQCMVSTTQHFFSWAGLRPLFQQ